MPSFSPSTTAAPEFVALMQALAGAHQSMCIYDAALHREAGGDLTPSQADVLFTLGGTEGMTCADLGVETCITKGTLTGVVDRLRAKGLVERWSDAYDARRTIIALTDAGERVCQRALPQHLARLAERFSGMSTADQRKLTALLTRLSALFSED